MVVSASDVMPLAEHLMDKAHKMGNTSEVSKKSSDWLTSTGFLENVCVMFFNYLLGNKVVVTPNCNSRDVDFTFSRPLT